MTSAPSRPGATSSTCAGRNRARRSAPRRSLAHALRAARRRGARHQRRRRGHARARSTVSATARSHRRSWWTGTSTGGSPPERLDAILDTLAGRRGDPGLRASRFRRALGRRRGRSRAASPRKRCFAALPVELVRNGSRGLYWLEPLVEVETAGGPRRLRAGHRGRRAGPVRGRLPRGRTAPALPRAARGDSLSRPPGAAHLRAGRHHRSASPWRTTRRTAGIAGSRRALGMAPADIVEAVTQSGLRGRGGAAFPTGIKWKTVLDTPADQKYVVCNADEGDSGTFSDRMVMEGDPLVLIEGMTIAGIAVGATRGYIYLRSEYPHAHRALNEAIAAAYARGYLGRRRRSAAASAFDLEVRRRRRRLHLRRRDRDAREPRRQARHGAVQAAAARHRGAVRQADGHQQRDLASPRVPIILDRGAAVLSRLRHGPLARHAADPARRQHQARRPGGEGVRRHAARAAVRLRRRQPRPAGRSARCRWAARSARSCPSRSSTRRSTTRRSRPAGAMVGHGGIVAFDDTVDMAAMARYAMEFCAIESCGKCTPCRIGSTRGRGSDRPRHRRAAHDRATRQVPRCSRICATRCSPARCARWAAWRRSRC